MAQFYAIFIQALIFLIVALMTFALISAVERVWDQRRRLGAEGTSNRLTTASFLQSESGLNPFFAWVESSTSISDTAERNRIRRELALAGFENPAAPVWYVIARFGLAIGLPLGYIFLQSLSSKPATGLSLVFWALSLSVIGLLAPSTYVSRTAGARRTELEFEFPDTLDLMVVCVEAGLSLDATFVRVVQEVGGTHPRIAKEFGRMSEEVRAGRGRADAMRSMADRTDVPAIKSFVALVVQSEALGSSVGQTLRTFSTELRDTRYLKAEEKAMRIPVLMTIPLVACILPVIIAALLLPVVLDVMRVLGPALTGHQ